MIPAKLKSMTDLGRALRHGKKFLFCFLALLLVGLFAGHHLVSWPDRLRYPGELNFTEGMQLAEMLHLRQGVPIYAPPSPESFDATIYGPLYFLLGARLIDPQRPAYLGLRVVSMLGTAGCLAGCAILAFWLSRSYVAPALAPLLFLAYGILTRFLISAQCDIVALLLFFSGFLMAYQFRKSRVLLLAALPMLLGFFYKPQYVAAPLSVLLFLLLEKRYRLAMEFLGLLTLGGLGLLAFFQFWVFPGQAFILHFVAYNVVHFTWTKFFLGLVIVGVVFPVPLLMALGFLRLHPDKLLGCYLGFAFFLAVVAFAKVGSDLNYFLECALIISPLFAASLAEKIAKSPRSAVWFLLLSLALLGQWSAPARPLPADFACDRTVQDFLRRNVTPHSPALGYFTGDLVRAGLETPIADLTEYTALVRKGTFSDRDLVAQLAQRRFSLIMLSFNAEDERDDLARIVLTEPVRQSILQHYQIAACLEMPSPQKLRTYDRFYAWVPRRKERDE